MREKLSDRVKRLERELAELKARLSMLEARQIPSESHFHFPAPPSPPVMIPPVYGPGNSGTAAPWRNLPEITCSLPGAMTENERSGA